MFIWPFPIRLVFPSAYSPKALSPNKFTVVPVNVISLSFAYIPMPFFPTVISEPESVTVPLSTYNPIAPSEF